jgi:nucleoside-diphosphate-sugar epimerase
MTLKVICTINRQSSELAAFHRIGQPRVSLCQYKKGAEKTRPKMNPIHTVIGAGGAVGKSLVDHLSRNSSIDIRTVSRKNTSAANHVSASCLDKDSIIAACKGSLVVYLVVGIEYNMKVWKRDWPVIIENVISACQASQATLVFADNLYCYGDTYELLKPTLPYTTSDAISKKALIRADLCRSIEAAFHEKRIPNYAIVRASDFYGPNSIAVSHFGEHSILPLIKGKKAGFVVPFDQFKHSITFDDDFGRCLSIVGTNPRAWGRAWHTPSVPAMTFKEYCEIAAQVIEETGGPAATTLQVGRVMPPWIQSTMGIFVPFFKELKDMPQVWTRDYVVDSSDFENEFASEWGQTTSLKEGFKKLIEALRAKA